MHPRYLRGVSGCKRLRCVGQVCRLFHSETHVRTRCSKVACSQWEKIAAQYRTTFSISRVRVHESRWEFRVITRRILLVRLARPTLWHPLIQDLRRPVRLCGSSASRESTNLVTSRVSRMIVNEQNFPKRNSARRNFRNQRHDIFLLVQGWNND